jgi:hypothetical protein
MRFTPPYVLYGALKARQAGMAGAHAAGYRSLLEALRDDRYDFDAADRGDVVTAANLPIRAEV